MASTADPIVATAMAEPRSNDHGSEQRIANGTSRASLMTGAALEQHQLHVTLGLHALLDQHRRRYACVLEVRYQIIEPGQLCARCQGDVLIIVIIGSLSCAA